MSAPGPVEPSTTSATTEQFSPEIRERLEAERVQREERLRQWQFVGEHLGWIPEDQVSVERNELVLDDYQSSIGNHSYLEQVRLWEVQPGEGEGIREALLMLPNLLRLIVRDMMSDEERVAVGWNDIPSPAPEAAQVQA